MGQVEGVFWRNTVKPQVKRLELGRWERIETTTRDGFPDCVVLADVRTSLVELKSKRGFVEGLGTTAVQRRFLQTWCMQGGDAYLLARVGTEILFLYGQHVERTLSATEWRKRALVHGVRTQEFDWERMFQYLRHGYRVASFSTGYAIV